MITMVMGFFQFQTIAPSPTKAVSRLQIFLEASLLNDSISIQEESVNLFKGKSCQDYWITDFCNPVQPVIQPKKNIEFHSI